jgi:hypothetical protein
LRESDTTYGRNSEEVDNLDRALEIGRSCRIPAVALSLLAFVAGNASAAPVIQSDAFAAATEFGVDPGTTTDSSTTAIPGDSAVANVLRCVGTGFCAVQPSGGSGAEATAITYYGSNRARVVGEDHGDPNQDYVQEEARASSLWADEWVFGTPLPSITLAVSLDIHLDGQWSNSASAIYHVSVFDTTLPISPNPDDPTPFFPYSFAPVAIFEFESASNVARVLDRNGLRLVPVPDGGLASGSVDLAATLQFVPVSGRTYIVAARLFVATADGDSSADFDSTGELARIVVPNGVTLNSAAGANWNVVVSESRAAPLLAASGLALWSLRARRARPLLARPQ